MISEVPGGSARRPSSVTQINLFCRECGMSDKVGLFTFSFKFSLDFGDFGWNGLEVSVAIAFDTRRRRTRHQQLIGIIFQNVSAKTKLIIC